MSFRGRAELTDQRLPASLPCKSLVEKNEELWNVQCYIVEVQLVVAVFLHFKQIVQLEIKLEYSTVTTYCLLVSFVICSLAAYTNLCTTAK